MVIVLSKYFPITNYYRNIVYECSVIQIYSFFVTICKFVIYIYMYVCICMYIYIYIYVCVCVHVKQSMGTITFTIWHNSFFSMKQFINQFYKNSLLKDFLIKKISDISYSFCIFCSWFPFMYIQVIHWPEKNRLLAVNLKHCFKFFQR